MAESLGTIYGQVKLDVKGALNAYTELRQEHLSTVSALGSGAGALVGIGAAFTAVGVGMGAALLGAAKAAGEFERQLDFFGAVSGATVDQMEAVRQKALELNRDTIYTANEIGDAFTELAKAGASAGDILAGVGEAVIMLGSATDMPLQDAATSLTTILNTFQIAAEESVGVVDKLAGAANASSIDVQDLILTMTYAGASAKVAGIQFEDLNTAIAFLGERGIRGSKAGTGLRQMLNKLLAPTKKGSKALKELGIITEDGTNSLYEMDGSLKPIPQLLDQLNNATEGLTSAEKTDVLGRIFPITSLPTILSLLDGGSAAMARLNGEIDKTTAAEVASARLDNLSGDLEFLTSSVENLVLVVGQAMQGPMRAVVQGITAIVDWLAELDPAIIEVLVGFAAFVSLGAIIFGVLAMMAGGLLNFLQLILVVGPALQTLAQILGISATAIARFKAALLFPGTPIIAIILAIAGALVWFFTQTEQGQGIWADLMAKFQEAIAQLQPLIPIFLQLAEVVAGALGNALQFVVPLLVTLGEMIMNVLAPYIAVVTDLLSGLADAFSGVGSSASGMEGIIEIGTGILEGIVAAIPMIVEALVTLVTMAITALVGMLPTIISGAITLFQGLISGIIQVMPMVITAVIDLIMQVLMALITMLPMIIQGALTLFQGLVTGLAAALPMILQAVIQLILAVVQALIVAIPILLDAGIQVFMSLVEALPVIIPLLLEAVVQLITQLIAALVEMLPTLLEAGIELFGALIDAVIEIIPMLITTLINLIPVIIASLISMIPTLLQGAIQLFLAIVQAVPKIITQLIPAIINLIPTIISTVIGLIPQLLNAAVKLFMALVDAVPKVLPQIVNALISMGRQMIEGLVQGIGNMAGAVMDAIGGVVGGAIDWAKGLLGIKSPSRVFRSIGNNTILGMINGIDAMRPGLQRSFGVIEDSLDSFYDQVYAAREFDVMMNLQSDIGMNASSGLAAQFAELNEKLAEIADKDTVVVENMEVNNPEPEKPSESLPKGIRKAAYLVG